MIGAGSITICSVGDLMISDSPLYVSVGVGTAYRKIRDRLFCECKSVFQDADIVVGNLESVVYQPKDNTLSENQMSCGEDAIKDLKDSGFNVLNLANNHSLQHGTEALAYTQNICKKNGICGIGLKDDPVCYIDRDNIKVAFLSLCIHKEWYLPESITYENRINYILSEIQRIRAKDKSIVIIVSVHWGDEFALYPSDAQIGLAHLFVNEGVDLVLGHHAHVFQGIEEYERSLIVYGQGNFVSDMVPGVCRETGIVKVKISINNEEKKITYSFIPFYINDSLIPVKAAGEWFDERQVLLYEALKEGVSETQYWKDVNKVHRECHMAFRQFFLKHFKRYRIDIAITMLFEFVIRKFRRIIRKTNDGNKGSMNSEVNEFLETYIKGFSGRTIKND